MLALVATLAVTAWTAVQQHGELRILDEHHRAAAEQAFSTEVDNTTSQVNAELGRLTELIIGVRAFASSDGRDLSDAVVQYLQASGAADRFPDLLGALVIDERDPGAPRTSEIHFSEPTPAAEGHRSIMGDPRPDLGALTALLDDSPPEATPGLVRLAWDGRDEVGITFPVSAQLMSGADLGWVALLFDTSTFLQEAAGQHALIQISLSSAGSAGPAPGAPTTDLAIVRDPSTGALAGTRTVDVFGVAYLISAKTGPGFVETEPRGQLAFLVAAGAAIALAVFLVLLRAVRDRTSALAAAANARAAGAAIDRRFRASFESSPIGMAELDDEGTIVSLNQAMAAQIGLGRDETIGLPLSALVHDADRPAHEARMRSLLDGTLDSAQAEHRYRHTDEADIWVSESVSVVETSPSGRRALLVQSQDVTAHRRAAWELTQQALHDDLTGLPNRALFLNRLKHALLRTQRADERLAVMFLDVDRFKIVNDSLGHERGDELLIEIAKRIEHALRTGDTVARFGGDEFVILCEAVSGESEALAVAQRIQAGFEAPFVLGGASTYASASIGITLNLGAEDTADSLLRDADAAMYRAKEHGRNRTELFDHSMRHSIVASMEIESQLRGALENGEITVHYQAIVHPRSFKLAGFEALIRWNHPEKGLLGPAAFLGVAEDAGLIHLIDAFALRQTCRQIASWVATYPCARDLYVATNWSARHLGLFVQHVEQILAETGVDPRHLVIEVTEGFLLKDTDASLVALARLKDLGVRIAIDDFGTGYSSLSYLTRFDVDFLKIDQSFVSKLPEDAASAAVIGAIADMARRLGIGLVAEGVETDEQIHMLATLGAPRMQGYRFAKPRPADDIARQLEALDERERMRRLEPAFN